MVVRGDFLFHEVKASILTLVETDGAWVYSNNTWPADPVRQFLDRDKYEMIVDLIRASPITGIISGNLGS